MPVHMLALCGKFSLPASACSSGYGCDKANQSLHRSPESVSKWSGLIYSKSGIIWMIVNEVSGDFTALVPFQAINTICGVFIFRFCSSVFLSFIEETKNHTHCWSLTLTVLRTFRSWDDHESFTVNIHRRDKRWQHMKTSDLCWVLIHY